MDSIERQAPTRGSRQRRHRRKGGKRSTDSARAEGDPRPEKEGASVSTPSSEDEEEGHEVPAEEANARDASDQDEEDLRRSEGEGMLYAAATLEEEQEPQPGKFGRKAIMKKEEVPGRNQDEEDILRSEGEGMLYAASTWEEEERQREGVRAVKPLRGQAPEEERDQDEEDLRRSEGEGMPSPKERDEEMEERRKKEAKNAKNERETSSSRPESESEAYDRLMHEAQEEHKGDAYAGDDEHRGEEEVESLQSEREKRLEEDRESRERIQALVRAAEDEERRKRKTLKEREEREKSRRESEIEQLVTRQSLDIANRREGLLRRSRQRMQPIRWVPDEQAQACQSCQEPFTLLKRKHHCRSCGKIFCAKCSSKTSRVRWFEMPERVCDACYLELKGHLDGKVVLISGAQGAFMEEVAEEVARQGAVLAILSPDQEQVTATAERIKARSRLPGSATWVLEDSQPHTTIQRTTGNAYVTPLWADFASMDSVHGAIQDFRNHHDRLDVLLNNSTILPKSGRSVHALTHDGHDKLFALNCLSHLLVTFSVLDLLKLGTPSRVVNVCPRPSEYVTVNFDDLQMEESWKENRAIEQSRLAIYCLTRELGLRLKGQGVSVNALDLGLVYSPNDAVLSRLWNNLKGGTAFPDAKEGCMYMIASPLTQEVSRGCFLPDGRPITFKGSALNDAFCARLARASFSSIARWVGPERQHDAMMEGRRVENTLAERIRAATSDDELRRRHIAEEEAQEVMNEMLETADKNVRGSGIRPLMTPRGGDQPTSFEKLHELYSEAREKKGKERVVAVMAKKPVEDATKRRKELSVEESLNLW